LRRKEGRKEGKGFNGLLVFDLGRLCEGGMSTSRRVGLVVGSSKGREEEKGFWVLVVLTCFPLSFWFLVFDGWLIELMGQKSWLLSKW
jgi:hypothetical protein